MRYPEAPRLDLVEDLHGHRVPDPYRWLEDPDDPRTRVWTEAQDSLAAEYLARLPLRAAFAARLGELVHAGAVGVPVRRGDRLFSTRRDPGQEHAVLRVREPDGSVRVLVDPMTLDAAGTTTLDAWSPSWEGDRLAYQVSVGGDEESRLYVLDVTTGELVEGPIDRCRYSPVAWLPGGEELFYVRRLAPGLVPAGEEQFHRRVWRHRVGTDPDGDILVHGEGSDPATYFGVRTSREGRWLVVSASIGTAPRDDVWLGHLAGSPPAVRPLLREVQVGVDAQTAAWVARDGRLWLMSDRDAPRWRLAVADPADPATWAPQAWTPVVPEQQDGVLSDVALVDGPDGAPQVLAVHSVDATDRLSVWAAGGSAGSPPRPLGGGRLCGFPAPPPRRRDPARRRQHRRCQRTARRRDDGVGRLHRLRDAAVGVPLELRRARRPGRARARAGRRCGPAADRRGDARDAAGRHAGAPVRAVRGGGAGPPVPDRALRLRRLRRGADPGLLGAGAGLGGRRRRVGRGQPARRLRARRGVAPRGHARAQAERVRRLRRRRRAPDRAGVDDVCAAGRHGRVERRAARRRHPHPAAGPGGRCGVQRAAAGHGALRAFRARPDLERRVRHRRGPHRARLAARLLPVPRGAGGHRLPGCAAHDVRVRHPGGPAARPQAHRRAAARHRVTGTGGAAAGDLGGARRPGGQPHRGPGRRPAGISRRGDGTRTTRVTHR